MLLPIRPSTSRAAIFSELNKELGYFLNASVDAQRFAKSLFSPALRSCIWGNEPTKAEFKKLWKSLRQLDREARESLSQEFEGSQFIQRFYHDKQLPIPSVPEHVLASFDSLAKHLFNRTAGLVGVKNSCGETLHQFLESFQDVNGKVCCFCGSSVLVQYRAGVEGENQWRAANDHLLAKDVYPIFSVHPDNLVPVCDTCNSKAKLAKDILFKKVDGQPSQRRACFYPFTESVCGDVGVEVETGSMGLKVKALFNTEDPDVFEKIDTWDDVYRIKERVEGQFIELTVLVDSDCPAIDIDQLRELLRSKAERYLSNVRLEAWNFWRAKLYGWLCGQNEILELLWGNIQEKRADADAAAVYGI